MCLASRRPAATVQIYVYKNTVQENKPISFIRIPGDSVHTIQGGKDSAISHNRCAPKGGGGAPGLQHHEIKILNTQITSHHDMKRLTFRHLASSILDRHFATLQRTLFIYLINKYISLSDIFLTVHH